LNSWLNNKNRPFIIIYEDQSETEELGVLNLTSARVDYKTDLEEMLQVRIMVGD
jgi:kinesin family protein 1